MPQRRTPGRVRYHRAMSAGPDARAPDPSLRSIKQALRGRILALRDDLAADARSEASLALVTRIAALPSFRAAGSVLLTLPYRSEWDTKPLATSALVQGKIVAMPRVDRVARMLILHRVNDLDRDIVRGGIGIPEPRPTAPQLRPDAIDWVLVPGVAFDAAGRRLGYGGGFYDRLLPLLRPEAPCIAGALDLQVVDEVPASPHDRRVDLVITPTRRFP